MRRSWALASAASLLTLACAGEGEDESSSTTSSTSTTSSMTGTGEAGETEGAPVIACGELECSGGEVCLSFPQEPDCAAKREGVPCPGGTTETQCGGAGLPCCCGPTPAPVYECVTPVDCGDAVDCSCLSEQCVPACSATGTEGVFICEAPPPP